MVYENRKTEEYLRKNNIIQDDEEFLMSFPNVKSTESIKSALWLAMAIVSSIFCFFCLGFLFFDGNEAKMIGCVSIVIWGFFIYISVKNRHKARNRIHHFLTSKHVYFNYNIKKPYKHINIEDLKKWNYVHSHGI